MKIIRRFVIVEMIKKNHKERMKELATAFFDTFLL